MHYTGTIWRPPYEAASLLLEVTAGCTHHKCKFCTLYHDLPFKFRMSPPEDIECDLEEVKRAMKGLSGGHIRRVFLTGANPFVLSFDKLTGIAERIHESLPSVKSIGSFARITDITSKTEEELARLQSFGYDGLTIGIETGDDEALRFMNKGYSSADIIEQCQRLDTAGIHYNFFYLVGISGAGRGETGAKLTAELCSQIHPALIGANMLTIYPDSELYAEIQRGNWQEEGELEKYKEVRTLIENLQIPVIFAAMGASNAYQFHGELPKDRKRLLAFLDQIIETASAELFSQLNPYFISVDSLTLFPDTELYQMAQKGLFVPAGEKERIRELQILINNLHIRTHLFANTVSNFTPVTAYLPYDREKITNELQFVLDNTDESKMQEYRKNMRSLG